MPVRFGTDGWRAVISEDFTFANLRQVAQAIADYLREREEQPTAVVGFDTRFLSDRYAIEVARVLAANGILVHLTIADTPTPALAFSISHLKASAGVMITASHNPPRYNGVKLKGPFGEPAAPHHCRRVEELLQANLAEGKPPRLLDYREALEKGLIRRFDPAPAYRQRLASLVDLRLIARSGLRVVVDPMYGAGRNYLRDILQEVGLEVREIRGEMNPGFGGIHPEPIERYLGALRKAVLEEGADLGLATDGDADRIGAMDAKGRFVDPHRIFALALRHLVERRGLRGKVVKSISTTRMIDLLTARYGLPLLETPVGFNHIAEHILRGEALIGGEESGGIGIRGHIPDGDGILMGLLLLEIMAAEDKPLAALVEEMAAELGPFHYARRDLRLAERLPKAEVTRHLMATIPSHIAGLRVTGTSDSDGVKYILEDGSWLLIRPSGTEPLLRVYAEARSPHEVEGLLGFGESLARRLGSMAQD